MRLFQLIAFGKPYLSYFAAKGSRNTFGTYESLKRELLNDRYGNSHILEPIERDLPDAFLSIADDWQSQRAWAREKGLHAKTRDDEIVLAQIEEHRTEVFYNVDPIGYDSSFLKRLPGSVKRTVCWRAAPIGRADLTKYDRCVCNFQGLLDQWSRMGLKTAWFEPAHDPVASAYGRNENRPIDIAFVGSFSRHHVTRNNFLKEIAALDGEYEIRFHLSLGRVTSVIDRFALLQWMFPALALDRRLRAVTHEPVYGRAMYELFGGARIVINAAIDMASEFRGNMRCFEALGCGALMLSDAGVYPPKLVSGRDFESYNDVDDALRKIRRSLSEYDASRLIADTGRRTVEVEYSKAAQWAAFVALVDGI